MQVRGPLTTAANSLMRSTVAVGQLTSTGDRAKNLDICQGLIRQAKERGAQMLFLPECFSFIGSKWQETVAAGQSLTVEHGVVDIMAKYAKEYNLWLSLGGFNEKTMDGQEKVFNSHIIIDADGLTRAVYRKIHLFDVEVPNGPVLMESRYTAPGSQIVAVDSPVGRLGLSTCYDLRFPELYARLVEMGSQILLVPSAFTVPTGKAHWEVLLRARAIESQCYVIAAAQSGRHNEKRESYGHSLIIDPWGQVLADAGDESPCLISAEIDLEKINDIRAKIPVQQHRRHDIFPTTSSSKY